jgi:glucose-1-phosphate adenylyltransferase
MIVNFITDTHPAELKAPSLSEKISLDRVCVIVLGGGEGKRLEPLTKVRCKPAVSFGGRYTLIDVPISHALSSGLKKIFVIGQYLASTLQKHLQQTYFQNGVQQLQIQMLMPEEREEGKIWYKGTADAVRQNLHYFAEVQADYFLILSGDQLYNINFQEMIQFAVDTQAGMVIAAQPVNEKDATRMGVLKVEHGGTKLVDFYEKPKEKELLDQYFVDDLTLERLGYHPKAGKHYLGSMGIYCFKRQALFDLLVEDERDDFGKHLIETQMKKEEVHAYLYDGYWEDIGTVESYYHANLALTRHDADRKEGFQCYDEQNMIYSKPHFLPGAKIVGTKVTQSIICEGSVILADEVTRSIIGMRTIVKKGTIISDSILIGNEYYEKPPVVTGEATDAPTIGEYCRIFKAIIDENVTLGDGVQLVNKRGLQHYDSPDGTPTIYIRDGIIIVPRGTTLPSGFIL